jgi:hypothetical protein
VTCAFIGSTPKPKPLRPRIKRQWPRAPHRGVQRLGSWPTPKLYQSCAGPWEGLEPRLPGPGDCESLNLAAKLKAGELEELLEHHVLDASPWFSASGAAGFGSRLRGYTHAATPLKLSVA